MAISASDITFNPANNATPFRSGSINNLFADARVSDPTDYALVEVRNTNGALTYTSPVMWLSAASGGATVALAVADGTARALSYAYPSIDPTGLTYSTPTLQSAGIALPTLAAGQKCLVAIRRILSGATVLKPESNVLRVSGTSPI